MIKKISLSFALLIVLPKAVLAGGALYSFLPTKGAFEVGQNIIAKVYIRPEGNPINAAEATIHFPKEYLKAVSVSKADSIFKLWPVEPIFSNEKGTVNFGGGTTVPYSKSEWEILAVHFRVLKPGEGKLYFTQSRILLADGLGTNALAAGGTPTVTWKFVAALPPTAKPAEKVDALPPEYLFIQFPDGYITAELEPRISLQSFDSLSGIDHFEIKIDDGEFFDVGLLRREEDLYRLPPLSVGRHTVYVKVFDKAGNTKESSISVLIIEKKPEVYTLYFLSIIILLILLSIMQLRDWFLLRKIIRKLSYRRKD